MKNVFRPYRNKSTINLINSMMVLNSCRIPGIVRATIPILKLSKTIGTTKITDSFIKNTFFKYFCGGEDVSEVVPVMERFSNDGINSILDLAIEETGMCKESITEMICKSIDIAKHHDDNFVSIKISALEDLYNQDFNNFDYTHLNKICKYAKENGVMVMVDAESSKIQPFIDTITLKLADTWNTENTVVWNTYQMYLLDSFPRLVKDLQFRKSNLGVKLVRGAYMDSEPGNILQPSVKETHKNYDKAVEYCVNEIRQTKSIKLMLATHNQESIEACIKMLDDIPKGYVKFGQLYGMKDSITYNMANRGLNVYKYIPYGPVNTAIPYLIRRAQENSNMLSGISLDNKLYVSEILKRF